LSVVLTPGQRHDSTQLGPVLDATRVPRPSGQGRPRKRPDHLVGDKAYSYRGRNVVERCFNRLKQFRAVATRFEKRAVNYQAMVVIASLLIWLEG
jgi:transposase